MECLKKKYQFILQYVHFPGKYMVNILYLQENEW